MDILLRFAGGGPSLSELVLEAMPSGAGEPVCEVCCEAGGDGYGCDRAVSSGMSGGGEGERLARLDSGEEGTLESGDDKSEPESSMVQVAEGQSRTGAEA